MTFNIAEQLLFIQLKHLYATIASLHDFSGQYSELYDHCAAEHQMSFTDEQKKEYWLLAKAKFKRDHKSWMKKGYEEMCKKEMEKIYKSFLVRDFLRSKLPETLKLHREDGTLIKELKIVGYEK